jgi:hypothetical protein
MSTRSDFSLAATTIVKRILRRGEIVEIVGRLSSGRTSLLVACLRRITLEGAVTALVDTDDTFDPRSAARAGVNVQRLLWVRCGGRREIALRATDLLIRCPGFALVALDTGETPPRVPLTRGFRLKLAVRRTDATLLVIGRRRITGSAATRVFESTRLALEWCGPAAVPTRLAGMQTRLRILRGHDRELMDMEPARVFLGPPAGIPGSRSDTCQWIA